MPRTVVVDFDGVIHQYSKGWQDGTIYDPPVSGAIEALHTLQKDFAVVVQSSRDPAPIAKWLISHGVKADTWHSADPPVFFNDQTYVLVTRLKLPAVAYIDDRAIRFVNWQQAVADLVALEA